MNLKKIGVVYVGPAGFQIQLEPEYIPALQGVGGFSHIHVYWWSHLLESAQDRAVVQCSQPYKNSPQTLGIFATRSPQRPNPICDTIVPVIAVDEDYGTIQIAYIDAEAGTPILDIKPYHPCVDRLRDVRVPEWSAHWPSWYEDSATFDWEAEFVNAT